MEKLNYSNPRTETTRDTGRGYSAFINWFVLLAAGITLPIFVANGDIYARFGAVLIAGGVFCTQFFIAAASIVLHPRRWWLPCLALAAWAANIALAVVLPHYGGHC